MQHFKAPSDVPLKILIREVQKIDTVNEKMNKTAFPQ